ncbi:hypothetical protein FB45DRAFT_1028266 [Roridomyces roridus]|uniref:Uncharacterized protein n=1 Tax=Roridomyces roridus TaxID=1738132 RepID=A0AAD7FP26_9AGAR|nr:hypothetical protein FB45DRAFT_1028266 [Roridomyces roridus]
MPPQRTRDARTTNIHPLTPFIAYHAQPWRGSPPRSHWPVPVMRSPARRVIFNLPHTYRWQVHLFFTLAVIDLYGANFFVVNIFPQDSGNTFLFRAFLTQLLDRRRQN